MTSDELDAHALGVLAHLADALAPTLYALSAGLKLAGEPVGLFAGPLFDLACDRERGQSVSTLSMRAALKLAALDGALIGRLADAEEPFWKATGDALAAIAETAAALDGPSQTATSAASSW